MFDKQAKRIAEAQVELGQISEEEKALIQYGLEAGFGFIAYLVLSLAVGLLSGRLLEAIVFTAAFMCLRPYAGGYHAGSQIRCLVLSTLLTAAALILTVLLQGMYQFGATAICWIIGSVLILACAPVGTSNKPLDSLEIRVYGRNARIILGVESVVLAILQIAGLYAFASILAIAVLSIGINVCVEYVRQHKRSA